MAAVAAANAAKKNMAFKMSKKVAELTQVVHMLFTRNHEKEVELEAVRASYEHEISLVLDDARGRIQTLQTRLDDLEAYKNNEEQRRETQMKDECQKREAELSARIHELEAQLTEEKSEAQSSRDLLIRTQRDLQDIKQVHAQELSNATRGVDDRDREIAKLKNEIVTMNKDIRNKDSLLDSKGELLRTHEKLRRELDQLRTALQGMERSREEASNKNRHLDSEVKALKKELAKRSSERHSAKVKSPVAVGNSSDYNEEIEQLRRELLRYKMELSNRENNFNRVFSERQPVTTDWTSRRYGRSGTSQDGGLPNATRLAREKTYAGESFTQDIRELESPRGSQSAAGRPVPVRGSMSHNDQLFPQLMENKLHRLVKPRPLPKELLSGKTSGAR